MAITVHLHSKYIYFLGKWSGKLHVSLTMSQIPTASIRNLLIILSVCTFAKQHQSLLNLRELTWLKNHTNKILLPFTFWFLRLFHCIVDSFLYSVWWPVWRTIFSQPTDWNHSNRMFPNKVDDSMCNAIHRSYNDTNQVNMTYLYIKPYEKLVVTTYTTSMDTKSFAALSSIQFTTAPRIGQNCALLVLYKGKPSMLNCTTTESKPFPADSLQSSSWHHNPFNR